MSSPIRAAAAIHGAPPPLQPERSRSDLLQDSPNCLPSLTLGVAVAGAGAALIAALIEPFALKGGQLPNLAAAYVLVTAGLAWGGAYASCRWFRAADHSQAGAVAGLTAAAGVWWAPLAVFIRDDSEWSLLAAVILAASITRLFDALALYDQPPRAVTRDLISIPEIPAGHWAMHAGAVLLLESSVIAIADRRALLASLLIAAATMMWVRRFDVARGSAFCRRAFSARVSRRLSAASLLTVIALLPHLRMGYGVAGGDDWSVIRAFKALLDYVPGHTGTVVAARRDVPKTDENDNTGVIPGPVFPGVILYSEPRVTQLVPPPIMSESSFFGHRRAEPYVIPFRGVYWILRRPDLPPPKTSLVMRGSPAKRAFTSNDYQPLWMEAHDNLGTLIDVRCCSAVKLELTGADRRPNDVRIELLLENTREGNRWMSLGVRPLPADARANAPPVRRTLSFPIPRHPRIEQFNRFTVRYELRGSHSFHSARVAIDDFVLLPR